MHRYRYPKDVYDRIWNPYHQSGLTELSTTNPVDPNDVLDYCPPSEIMSTATTPTVESDHIEFHFEPPNNSARYYIYLHFAELQLLEKNESRAFEIFLNGRLWYNEPVTPLNFISTTYYSTSAITGELNYSLSITKFKNSSLPPILNALEMYTFLDLAQAETHEDDGMLIFIF